MYVHRQYTHIYIHTYYVCMCVYVCLCMLVPIYVYYVHGGTGGFARQCYVLYAV